MITVAPGKHQPKQRTLATLSSRNVTSRSKQGIQITQSDQSNSKQLTELLGVIYDNYSPKWRWVVVVIYRGREVARLLSTTSHRH